MCRVHLIGKHPARNGDEPALTVSCPHPPRLRRLLKTSSTAAAVAFPVRGEGQERGAGQGRYSRRGGRPTGFPSSVSALGALPPSPRGRHEGCIDSPLFAVYAHYIRRPGLWFWEGYKKGDTS